MLTTTVSFRQTSKRQILPGVRCYFIFCNLAERKTRGRFLKSAKFRLLIIQIRGEIFFYVCHVSKKDFINKSTDMAAKVYIRHKIPSQHLQLGTGVVQEFIQLIAAGSPRVCQRNIFIVESQLTRKPRILNFVMIIIILVLLY